MGGAYFRLLVRRSYAGHGIYALRSPGSLAPERNTAALYRVQQLGQHEHLAQWHCNRDDLIALITYQHTGLRSTSRVRLVSNR
jgi:hypothetical protein